jgi:hypothetical protein
VILWGFYLFAKLHEYLHEGNTDPKTLVITGVSGFTNANTAVLLYKDQDPNAMPIAASSLNQNSGTLTFPLYKVTGDSSNWQWNSDRWTGNGSYYIILNSTNSLSGSSFWGTLKAHDKVSFDAATITVAYNTTDWVTP